MESQPKRILHVITGIDVGGAEFMLMRTIEHSDRARFRHLVVCLGKRGELAARIESAGAERLACLGIRGPLSALRGFVRLCHLIRRENVDVVQTWLAHGTLFGSLASLMAGNPRILWCIHTGNQDASRVSLPVRIINRLLSILSRIAPRIIVSVSESVSDRCIRLGFDGARIRVIPNGTDTGAFQPDPPAGGKLRHALAIPDSTPLVGIIGRNTPEKDFASFFQAALELQRSLPETHFLLCGKGLEPSMKEAVENIPLSSSPQNFHFCGARQDMQAVYNACTIVVLTSFSEAFPLVLGEAMACGVPVAATDVGDCRALVGDAGVISPPRQASSMAASWMKLLKLPPSEYRLLAMRARQRILDHFAMRQCIDRYEMIYEELLEPAHRAARVTSPSAATASADPIT